jgi:mRNA interferase HigB
MRIVHWGRAKKFWRDHPDARVPLMMWRDAVTKATWKNFPDVQKTFTRASFVDGKTVFNIKSNVYRLVAAVVFEEGTLYIRYIMTHEVYDLNKWRQRKK